MTLLHRVGLDEREAHGFAVGPIALVIERTRPHGETQIRIRLGMPADPIECQVRAPGSFVVEMALIGRELADLHDKWMREGDDWLPPQTDEKD